MATSKAIRQQHEEVLTHVDRLELLLGRDGRGLPPAHLRMLVRQHLGALHSVLEQHFAAEEEGGYMAEPLKGRPDLGHRAERIQIQHGEILHASKMLGGSAPEASLDRLREEVQRLIHALREHEAAERELVEDAVLQDYGFGD